MNYQGNDFYCDMVLSGKEKVNIVKETDNVVAFHHTKPSFDVHIVVIPKKHVASLLTLEDQDLTLELIKIIQEVAADVEKENGAVRVATNIGEYQDSKHLHFHVVFGKR